MEKFIMQLAQKHFEVDRQAFINFIHQNFALNGDEITDIYNDVWMDVIENIRRGRTERVRNWKSYVFGLGWKRACKLVSRRTEMERIDSYGYYGVLLRACNDIAEEDAIHIGHLEKIESLMVELDAMPDKHREILMHYYLEEMTTAEIASLMGYSGARCVITLKKRSLMLLHERMRAIA